MSPKLKIDRALYDRLTETAEQKGYASAEEFMLHVLEQAASSLSDKENQAVNDQLRGLGYIE